MMDELSPCKRCGGKMLFLFKNEKDASYHCVSCLLEPKRKTPEQIAREQWNLENAP